MEDEFRSLSRPATGSVKHLYILHFKYILRCSILAFLVYRAAFSITFYDSYSVCIFYLPFVLRNTCLLSVIHFKTSLVSPNTSAKSTITDVILVLVSSYSSSAHVLQKSTRHFKIIDAKRVTRSSVHTKDAQALGAKIRNLVSTATRNLGFFISVYSALPLFWASISSVVYEG